MDEKDRKKLKGVILREKEKGFWMSRVPRETKELFIKIAEEQFEEDYGMFLKTLVDNYVESQNLKIIFFENIDYKLNHILELLTQKEEKPEKVIKMLSGRKVMKGGNKE